MASIDLDRVGCVLACVAFFAGTVIVLLGFFWVLFTGEVNRQIKAAGQRVAHYLYNIARYLTFNTMRSSIGSPRE